MNPALIILILLGAVALWFLLSFAFRPLGGLICKIWKNVDETINEEENETEEEKKGEK